VLGKTLICMTWDLSYGKTGELSVAREVVNMKCEYVCTDEREARGTRAHSVICGCQRWSQGLKGGP